MFMVRSELLVHGAFNKWWDLPQKLVRPQSQGRVSLRFSLTQFRGGPLSLLVLHLQ